jgi:hypothetical protein
MGKMCRRQRPGSAAEAGDRVFDDPKTDPTARLLTLAAPGLRFRRPRQRIWGPGARVALKLITEIEQCGASPTLDTRLARLARLDHKVIRLIGADHFPHPTRGSSGERLHGPFVSDEEIERVASFLKTRGIPDYIDQITEDDDAPLDPLSGDEPAPLILAGRVGGATGDKGPRDLLGWKRKPARKALLTCFALVSLRRALQNDVLLRHASAWAVIKSDIPEVHRNHHISFLCWRDRAQIQEFSTAIVEPVRATDPKVFG